MASTKVKPSPPALLFDGTYVAGDHRKTRTARWPDTVAISAATGLFVLLAAGGVSEHFPCLTIKPASGTITKAGGYRIDILFAIVWQRTLTN